MGALYALASSVLYGVADFAGGLLSRRMAFAVVALAGQASGLALMLVVAPLVPGTPTMADLGWGALSGIGTGGGMALLYRGLSRGAMSVVVPVCAVGGLAVPALVGIVVLRDRPTALAVTGMVLAVPALWLAVPRSKAAGRAGVTDGLAASVFIAVQYLALAMAVPAAGMWPVLAGRVTATLAVLPLAWRELSTSNGRPQAEPAQARARSLPPERRRIQVWPRTPRTKRHRTLAWARTPRTKRQQALAWARTPRTKRQQALAWARDLGPQQRRTLLAAAVTGACATLALVAYLLATRTQLLSIAVVLSSLYPVIPVLLGLTVLRERLTRLQVAGLLAATAAIMLLTLG